MVAIDKLVGEYIRFDQEATTADKQRRVAVAESKKCLDAIRLAIRKGKTSGSVATDLMYLQKGAPDEAVAKFFSQTEEKIKGKAGSLIVIAISTRGEYDDSGSGPDNIVNRGVTDIYAGILSDDKIGINMQYAAALIPTTSHLKYLHYLQREDKGPIWLWGTPKPHPHGIAGIDIYIGDEVLNLYESHPQFHNFVLEKKGKRGWEFLDTLPVPGLQLTG